MRARPHDRGAVIIEAAIAMTVLGVLLVGIIEYGFAWRQSTVVEKTVQQSGRTAANLADAPMADYEALQAFRSLIASTKNVTVDYIVVYKSGSADGAMPSGCAASSIDGVCNHYVPGDMARPAAQFGCGGSAPDRFWCPFPSGASQPGRERDRSPAPDYVGVQAQLQYDGMTGIVPGTITITRKAVYAVEPCAFGLPGC